MKRNAMNRPAMASKPARQRLVETAATANRSPPQPMYRPRIAAAARTGLVKRPAPSFICRVLGAASAARPLGDMLPPYQLHGRTQGQNIAYRWIELTKTPPTATAAGPYC